MQDAIKITPSQLNDFLMHVATSEGAKRSVMVWGPPGTGKSSLVEEFALDLEMDCVSLLGSQLAPEDLIGVPEIRDGRSHFCPPSQIARDEAYVLFLDELNACSHDVQKAFYSLIQERRLGEYKLHPDSIVIAAGNRSQDSAIVKPMSSALLNRLMHVHLRVSTKDWMNWAKKNGISHLVLQYLQSRPEHLHSNPPKIEIPFSTPRSWHMLSDALNAYEEAELTPEIIQVLSTGCLTPAHAARFNAFCKGLNSDVDLNKIIKGEMNWPSDPEDADLLYDLALSFKSRLLKELPESKERASQTTHELRHNSKALLKNLASINMEYAQLVVSDSDDTSKQLPGWFIAEIVRDLPRLIEKKED